MKMDPAKVTIDYSSLPPGSHGFRQGSCVGFYDGRRFRWFTSVSHYAELDQQRIQMLQSACTALRTGNFKWESLEEATNRNMNQLGEALSKLP